MDADACARLGRGNCSHAGECFTSSMAVSPGLPMVVQHGGPWECLTSSYPGRSAVPCQAMPSHRRSGCKERHATDARVLRRRGRSQIISTQMARQPPRPSGNGGPMGTPTVVELPEQSAGAAACHAASNTNAPGWAGRLSCSPVSPPSLASWPASRLPIPWCCCCYRSSLLSLPLPEPAPRPQARPPECATTDDDTNGSPDSCGRRWGPAARTFALFLGCCTYEVHVGACPAPAARLAMPTNDNGPTTPRHTRTGPREATANQPRRGPSIRQSCHLPASSLSTISQTCRLCLKPPLPSLRAS